MRTGSDAEWRELRGGCYGRSSDSGDVGVGAKMERGTRKQAEGCDVAVGSEKQKCSAHALLGEGEEQDRAEQVDSSKELPEFLGRGKSRWDVSL